MHFYHGNLLCFALLNSILVYNEYSHKKVTSAQKPKLPSEGFERESARDKLKKFKWSFIPVYLAVNGADWLQGLCLYPLYKDGKHLSEERVASLFMTGFISATVTATVTGKLADVYGRRLACLSFCVIYSISCLSLLTDNIPILYIGRVFSGAATTLMYTVFESWMVTEFNKNFPNEPGSTLSSIFSTMTTLNTAVIVAAGVVAECVTIIAGTQKAPFMVAVVVLMGAFLAINRSWGENYGENRAEMSPTLDAEKSLAPMLPRNSLIALLKDKQIRALGITSCCLEGSIFVFMYFKISALQLSHTVSGINGELPFGLIFATLMSTMMFGSLLYNLITRRFPQLPPTRILISLLLTASASLFVPVVYRDERVTFWCFCSFEICCGIYFPWMAYQKAKLVDDSDFNIETLYLHRVALCFYLQL
ncbi:hypothetical protein VTL71DRAFT_2007 [Oculimacula yallundae]|uniref:Molybdate-anion transporter n=1 Tax=Oculimacula yallundae TaxID=86028 RepID=A0ABR4CCC6_9HELO